MIKFKYYENQKVEYDDIVFKRKSFWKLFLLSALVGFAGKKFYKMSNLWMYTCYIPLALLFVHDMKNIPYDEIENFYKYSLEVTKTKAFYEQTKQAVNEALVQIDLPFTDSIKQDLSETNKTLFEVVSDIDAQLLKLAEKSLIV